MATRKKIVLVAAFTLWSPITALLGYSLLYVPIKFHYLVAKVESARTAAEERVAFETAANRGRVWEVNRLRPEEIVTDGRQISGDWLLRLEWLESSPYSGGAYVAYRAVIDTNNLQILYKKTYK